MVDKLHQGGGYPKLSWKGIKNTAGKYKSKITNLFKGRQIQLFVQEAPQKDKFKGIRNFFKNPTSSVKKINLGFKAKRGTSSKRKNKANRTASTILSTDKKPSTKSQFESQLKKHSNYVSTQEAADKQLITAKPGDYAIRPHSQKADKFTLIIKNKAKYVIEIADNGFNVIDSKDVKTNFSTLESLIDAYLPKKQPEVKVYDDISEIEKGMDTEQKDKELNEEEVYNAKIANEFETYTGAEFKLRRNSNFVDTATKAEEKMKSAKQGDYLIRQSSDGKKYTLEIKNEGIAEKRNIEPFETKYKVTTPGSNTEKIFDNLDQLILYYRLK